MLDDVIVENGAVAKVETCGTMRTSFPTKARNCVVFVGTDVFISPKLSILQQLLLSANLTTISHNQHLYPKFRRNQPGLHFNIGLQAVRKCVNQPLYRKPLAII